MLLLLLPSTSESLPFRLRNLLRGENKDPSPFRVQSLRGRNERSSADSGSSPSTDTEGIFINAGGKDYTDANGITWITDKGYYSSGKRYATSAAISETSNPTIYQTERYGTEMTFDIPVTNGVKYDVYLHFAEIYERAFRNRARVFDVFVEGELVADNIDIYKETGGGYKAYVLCKEDIIVNDGMLSIDLIRIKQKAKISAIEIRPAGALPATCTPVTVDFGSTANGVALQGGMYVSDEWASIGMSLWTIGGLAGETRPRLFNTSSVGNDPDLGAPNEWCPMPGPGKGVDGKPDGKGPNCDPLGLVLIIQNEDDTITVPDDNVNGGSIVLDFTTDVPYIAEIGLLDIDYDASITLTHHNKRGADMIDVPVTGDNSFQRVSIDKWNVKRMVFELTRSGAIAYISFCHGNSPPPTNHCDPNPCQNGGTCINEVGGYTCNCLLGFEGDDCGTNIDDCSPINPCQNGGSCVDGIDSYICECVLGYVGVSCENGICGQIGNDIDGEAPSDYSGSSVALSSDGSTLAIGARYNDGVNGVDSGHVRVYKWDKTMKSWIQVGEDIDGEAASDSSGVSVSLSGNGRTLAVGAHGNDGIQGIGSGHVRVYNWNGDSWIQQGSDIDGEAPYDASGFSVSLSNDGCVLAIGTPFNDGNGHYSGHVRIYKWKGSSWVQQGSDIDGEAVEDQAGYSISLSSDGNTLAVGARYNDGINGIDSGHVRVHQWDGNTWKQQGSDIDGDSAAGDSLGYSAVSLSSDGRVLAVGAPGNRGVNWSGWFGTVRVYKWVQSSWTQQGSDIDGKMAGDFFGSSVSLSSDGSVLAIGAPYEDGGPNGSGLVRVYKWNGTSWIQHGSDIDGEGGEGDEFGHSVSLSSDGNVLAIGARGNNNYTGHVRVYGLTDC